MAAAKNEKVIKPEVRKTGKQENRSERAGLI